MILTVTTNPAIDVTYQVSSLRPGDVHVRRSRSEPAVRASTSPGSCARWASMWSPPPWQAGRMRVASSGSCRRKASGRLLSTASRAFVAPWSSSPRTGPPPHCGNPVTGRPSPSGSAARLTVRVTDLLASARVLWSSPAACLPTSTRDCPHQLARLAVEAGTPVVVDVDGEALDHVVRAGGAVVAPNRDEAGALLGSELRDRAEVRDAAAELCHRGARGVLVTCGPEGALLQLDARAWWRGRPRWSPATRPVRATRQPPRWPWARQTALPLTSCCERQLLSQPPPSDGRSQGRLTSRPGSSGAPRFTWRSFPRAGRWDHRSRSRTAGVVHDRHHDGRAARPGAGSVSPESWPATSSRSSTPRRSSTVPSAPADRWCCSLSETPPSITAGSPRSPWPACGSLTTRRCRPSYTSTTPPTETWWSMQSVWASPRSCTTRPACPTTRTSPRPARLLPGVTSAGSGWRRPSGRSGARTGRTRRESGPTRGRPVTSSPRPESTHWPWRSDLRTRCSRGTPSWIAPHRCHLGGGLRAAGAARVLRRARRRAPVRRGGGHDQGQRGHASEQGPHQRCAQPSTRTRRWSTLVTISARDVRPSQSRWLTCWIFSIHRAMRAPTRPEAHRGEAIHVCGAG